MQKEQTELFHKKEAVPKDSLLPKNQTKFLYSNSTLLFCSFDTINPNNVSKSKQWFRAVA